MLLMADASMVHRCQRILLESLEKLSALKRDPKFQSRPSESSSATVLRRSSPLHHSSRSIDEGYMSSNGVETTPAGSSSPQTSGDAQTQSSSKGKQPAHRRKTYHGPSSLFQLISNARSSETAKQSFVRARK